MKEKTWQRQAQREEIEKRIGSRARAVQDLLDTLKFDELQRLDVITEEMMARVFALIRE